MAQVTIPQGSRARVLSYGYGDYGNSQDKQGRYGNTGTSRDTDAYNTVGSSSGSTQQQKPLSTPDNSNAVAIPLTRQNIEALRTASRNGQFRNNAEIFQAAKEGTPIQPVRDNLSTGSSALPLAFRNPVNELKGVSSAEDQARIDAINLRKQKEADAIIQEKNRLNSLQNDIARREATGQPVSAQDRYELRILQSQQRKENAQRLQEKYIEPPAQFVERTVQKGNSAYQRVILGRETKDTTISKFAGGAVRQVGGAGFGIASALDNAFLLVESGRVGALESKQKSNYQRVSQQQARSEMFKQGARDLGSQFTPSSSEGRANLGLAIGFSALGAGQIVKAQTLKPVGKVTDYGSRTFENAREGSRTTVQKGTYQTSKGNVFVDVRSTINKDTGMGNYVSRLKDQQGRVLKENTGKIKYGVEIVKPETIVDKSPTMIVTSQKIPMTRDIGIFRFETTSKDFSNFEGMKTFLTFSDKKYNVINIPEDAQAFKATTQVKPSGSLFWQNEAKTGFFIQENVRPISKNRVGSFVTTNYRTKIIEGLTAEKVVSQGKQSISENVGNLRRPINKASLGLGIEAINRGGAGFDTFSTDFVGNEFLSKPSTSEFINPKTEVKAFSRPEVSFKPDIFSKSLSDIGGRSDVGGKSLYGAKSQSLANSKPISLIGGSSGARSKVTTAQGSQFISGATGIYGSDSNPIIDFTSLSGAKTDNLVGEPIGFSGDGLFNPEPYPARPNLGGGGFFLPFASGFGIPVGYGGVKNGGVSRAKSFYTPDVYSLLSGIKAKRRISSGAFVFGEGLRPINR